MNERISSPSHRTAVIGGTVGLLLLASACSSQNKGPQSDPSDSCVSVASGDTLTSIVRHGEPDAVNNAIIADVYALSDYHGGAGVRAGEVLHVPEDVANHFTDLSKQVPC
jgi:hypothetical protein